MKRFSGILAAVAMASGPATAKSPFGAAVADSDLASIRGGLRTPIGIDVNFSVEITTRVDGDVALRSVLTPGAAPITVQVAPVTPVNVNIGVPPVVVPPVNVPPVAQVNIPDVTVPSVSVPPTDIPPVSIAPVDVAPVNVPPVQVTPVNIPAVDVAPTSVPPVTVAPISVPPVNVPAITPPAISVPPVNATPVEIAPVVVTPVNVPPVNIAPIEVGGGGATGGAVPAEMIGAPASNGVIAERTPTVSSSGAVTQPPLEIDMLNGAAIPSVLKEISPTVNVSIGSGQSLPGAPSSADANASPESLVALSDVGSLAAPVATAFGTVHIEPTVRGPQVMLQAPDLEVRHLVGQASTVIANYANNRVIDTTTIVHIDLPNIQALSIGAALSRIEDALRRD